MVCAAISFVSLGGSCRPCVLCAIASSPPTAASAAAAAVASVAMSSSTSYVGASNFVSRLEEVARRWGRERGAFPAFAAGGRAPFCTPPGAWAGSEGGFAMGRASKGRVADWFVGGLARCVVGVRGARGACGVGAVTRGLVTFVPRMGCMDVMVGWVPSSWGYTAHVHAVLDGSRSLGCRADFPWSGLLLGCLGEVRRICVLGKEGANERGGLSLDVESGGGERASNCSINQSKCALYRSVRRIRKPMRVCPAVCVCASVPLFSCVSLLLLLPVPCRCLRTVVYCTCAKLFPVILHSSYTPICTSTAGRTE